MSIFFPNIPDVPGVPTLPRDPLSLIPAVPQLFSDALSFLVGAFGGPQWGIFLDGVPLFPDSSVLAFDFKNEWSISDYQVEQGGFQSYDKVASPFDVKLRYAIGGSDIERLTFLLRTEALGASTVLVDVVTPDRVYHSCNVVHYDYRRTATNGVSLLTPDIWLKEVRVTGVGSFFNTQSPSGADTVQDGVVGTSTPTGTQAPAGVQ